MWTKKTFDELTKRLSFDVEVLWDRAPSQAKYGHVNSLLTGLVVLVENNCELKEPGGNVVNKLIIAPLRRKVTDKKKRKFSIIGLPNVTPLIVTEYNGLLLEVYFNYHFFYETSTTFRQYFPGASLCIRPRNFLNGSLVPSPGSWGSDITSLDWDWDGTLIVETGLTGVTPSARKSFRGFKYMPSVFKIFLCAATPPVTEQRYIRNNGFDILVAQGDADNAYVELADRILNFLKQQHKRL